MDYRANVARFWKRTPANVARRDHTMKTAIVLLFLASCVGDDAPAPVPYCPDVGCPTVAVCTRAGVCSCDVGPDMPVTCTFMHDKDAAP